ncbi:MAG: hypothetical protein LBI53_06270 [Candidatus Peribacteria bacterium]|jgi:phosphoglycolate phosphatase-like HAD superfamily hydrolase|nr:hypothetical protein [Candidatus Peribacteria bacterium]
MPEELKQQIDTNKNNIVEEKELQDFLKKEENLKVVGELFQGVGKEELLKEIPHLEEALQKAVDIALYGK